MSWQFYDRLQAYFKRIGVFRQENLFTDQPSLDRALASGDFMNFSSQNALLEQTNLHINRLERYKDYDQMDEVGEISLSLDIYADESSLLDPELHHSVMVKSKYTRVKEELEELFYSTLLIDNNLRPILRYLCKYGDFPSEIIPTVNRDGVASIRFMNVYNFTRVETKFGDLVGFYYQDELTGQPEFMHPWQVIHMRLTTFENIFHPYGKSILNSSRKHFKQLRLMEDAALVYRLTRAPEKRIFKIPIGQVPAHEVPNYIEKVASVMKKKRFFDPATGDVNERWNPLIQEDDFWLPIRPDGTGPDVSTLPGAENLDQIADIEYFKKKMCTGLKIPFSRVGIGEQTESESKSLSQVAPEFAKAVQWIQREVVMGFKKLAIVHLAMRGFTEDEIKSFDLHMTASSAIDELYRIESWNSRADVIDALKGTQLFPDEWILKRFTDMTDDEIKQMKEEKDEEMKNALEAQGGEAPPGGAPGGMPPMDAGMPPLEGYNYDAERLLTERHKPKIHHISDSFVHSSGYKYMINNNELDGLKQNKTILVESILNKKDVVKAKSDVVSLLKTSHPNCITEDIDTSNTISSNID